MAMKSGIRFTIPLVTRNLPIRLSTFDHTSSCPSPTAQSAGIWLSEQAHSAKFIVHAVGNNKVEFVATLEQKRERIHTSNDFPTRIALCGQHGADDFANRVATTSEQGGALSCLTR